MSIQLITTRVVTLSPEHAPISSSVISTRKFSESRVRMSISRILQQNVLCSISTVSKNNRAHINIAYFAYSADLAIYFLSDPSSLHCQNLSTNSTMAIAVFNSSQQWTRPGRGMQLFGTCREAKGRQAHEAGRLYTNRFRAYTKWEEIFLKKRIRQNIRYRFYRFTLRRLKILDEREFGDGVFVELTVKRD